MKHKYLLVLLFIMLLPLHSIGQSDWIDISQYKLPDIKYKELNLLFNLSNDYQKDTEKDFYGSDLTRKYNYFEGLIDLNFKSFRSTNRYQGTVDVVAFLSPDIYSVEVDGLEGKDKNNRLAFEVSSDSRIYFNKFFVELVPDLSYSISLRKIVGDAHSGGAPTINVTTEEISGTKDLSIGMPLGFGYGRLEPVQDIRLAIYILEQLLKQGSIESIPDSDFIMNFAEKISEIKNSRYYDIRLRDIEDMKAIDKFLYESGILKNRDMVYYTGLRDEWDYSSRPIRLSGFRISAGLDNSFSKIQDYGELNPPGVNDDNLIFNRTNADLGIYLDMQYHKPHNLYFQSALGLRVKRNYVRFDTREGGDYIFDSYSDKIFSSSFLYKISYFHDSRTSVSLGVGFESLNMERIPDMVPDFTEDLDLNEEFISFNSTLDINRYISPRVTFFVKGRLDIMYDGLKIGYDDNYEDDNIDLKIFANSLAIGLKYKFF